MPRKRPPFVELWRDRHGKVRVYFRKDRGPRIPLPRSISSLEFEEAYRRALIGLFDDGENPRPDPRAVGTGTIAALIVSYMRSDAYTTLRQTTKAGYASRIEALRVQHGHRTIAGMNRDRINAILAPYVDRPGTALSILKMLRILIRHAIDTGWLNHDPSLGIKRPKTQEIRSWTEAEIEAFEKRWPIGTKQRLAFALMLHTGQRRSDVHRMTWADINNTTIRVVQQKTGAKLAIRLHKNLLAVLAVADRNHVTILNTEFGRPFTVDGFSQFMRDAIEKAGLPLDCQPHGLRRAAGRRLAETGCTTRQIMAVLGHKTLAEAERYTRDADQETLAAAAITKLEGEQSTYRLPKPFQVGLGKIRKKKEQTKC